ncbi:gasdermin-A2-like [Narcine bancroftii]|uniref:gasdermin-A2-like n=1 Tax=Narcine bancroftii TaxID=1343680 RepID=UPI003831B268
MFQRATKKIVSEIDPDGFTLIPATSSYHSQHCKPLNLLIKKEKNTWFSKFCKYVPTAFTLTDILLDGQDLDFGLSSCSFANFSQSSSSSVSGEIGVNVGTVDPGISASGSLSDSISNVEMKKKTISEPTLLLVTKDRKVNKEHNFVKRLMHGTIYMISEVIEVEKPCTVNNTTKGESAVKILMKFLKAESGVSISREEKLTVPAGTTIAYKVSELMINQNDTLELIYDVESRSSICEVPHDKKVPIITSLGPLTKLSADKKLLFLNTILEILGNNDDLPVLEEMLDQMCEGFQPDLQVLDEMEENKRERVEKVLDLLGIKKADPPGQPLTFTPDQEGTIRAVTVFIQSLCEMDPETLILLATSTAAKIIFTLLNLVKVIHDRWSLEPRLQSDQMADVQNLEKILISHLTDENFEITQQMLEEFGIQLNREDASISCNTCYKEENILSLFTALYTLIALND